MSVMDLTERLRHLGVHRGPGALKPHEAGRQALRPDTPVSRASRPLEALLPGALVDTAAGPAYVIDADHPGEHAHGRVTLADFMGAAGRPQVLAEIAPDPALARADLTRAAFLDTETTGLGMHAGTLVFLTGVGLFERRADGGYTFRVRQFFLREPGEEPAMLAALAEFVDGRPLVTFNGRAFDLPLLENRYILARRTSPLAGAPHLDLLHPARRLWRERVGSCALGALEQSILGVTRTALEVPGWMIPEIYANYLRTGDARELPGVLYHNRIDVLSMVGVAVALARGYGEPYAPGTPVQDVLSLARWHEANGRADEAVRAYHVAADGERADARDDVQAEALRRLGALLRRLDRRAEALDAWHALATLGGFDIEGQVELAKHYEWHARDAARAAEWARAALVRVRRWPAGVNRARAERELRHRLERLERKCRK
jgi:uncharacterized protein YprB with RNaseH-like and TPR domain